MATMLMATVVSVGAKAPRIAINVNDPDYRTKFEDPKNWYPAVLVKLDGSDSQWPLIVSEEYEKLLNPGDTIWVNEQCLA